MGFMFDWRGKQYTARLGAKRGQILSEMQKSKVPEFEPVFLQLPISVDERAQFEVMQAKS
jgi:hypothetical protein